MSFIFVISILILAASAVAVPHSLIIRDTAIATRHDFGNVNSGASCHPPDGDIASAYTGRLAHFDPLTRKSALISPRS